MKKTLATVALAVALVTTLSLVPGMPKTGIFKVDTVSAASETTTTTTTYTTGSVGRMLQLGCLGSDVKLLQTNLNTKGYKLVVDGAFGPLTLTAVKDFQKNNGLVVDGVAGPKTLGILIPAPAATTPTGVPTVMVQNGTSGSAVAYLQTNLNKLGYKLKVDSVFGPLTLVAVKDFQKNNGLVIDGVFGPKSFAKLYEKTNTPPPTTPTTPTVGQTAIKIGRVDYNAHGSGVVVAMVALAGDKIAAVSVDEYQFMDPSKITTPMPNTANLGKNYLDATKSVLASKLSNVDYYSQNMKTSGNATQTWDKNMAGVIAFAVGKTTTELDTAIKNNKTADGKDIDPKIDAVASATFTSTNGYLSAILAAAQNASKATTSSSIDASQVSNLKIGRVDYNAHGSGVVIAATVISGDKIVASSVDEYQFMDPSKITTPMPNTANLGKNYLDATKSVLASKLSNVDYYSQNMKTSGNATQTWDKNMAGVIGFAVGKTTAELDTAIKNNKTADGKDIDPKIDAVASATFTSTNGYLSAILAAAKNAK